MSKYFSLKVCMFVCHFCLFVWMSNCLKFEGFFICLPILSICLNVYMSLWLSVWSIILSKYESLNQSLGNIDFSYSSYFVALCKYNHNRHYILQKLCLHHNIDYEGSFRILTKFMHISKVPYSCKRTYMQFFTFHKKILTFTIGV